MQNGAGQSKTINAEADARVRTITAEAEAKSKTINADADARVVIAVGNADAEKARAVGTAEADVIKMKIASMESGNYAAVQIAQALAQNHVKLVPDIVAGGGGNDSGALLNVLLARMLQTDGAPKPALSTPAKPSTEQ
jgi:regulator of protease activity HflC (stomatin/prohibitin superfamily)